VTLPSSSEPLRLYSRQGCCLCEGLRERLEALVPPPPIALLDVDGDPELQARYGLRVPVLARPTGDGGWQDLPPVPPRLAGERLGRWLESNGAVGGAAASPPGALDPQFRQRTGFDAACPR
jgi:hypothetical protein